MSRWVSAGPFEVYLTEPGDQVRPDHEHQATGIAIPRHRVQQMHTESGLRTVLLCSRAEWAAFLAVAKSGALDQPVPPQP